jgi:hypothetical protein
LKKLAKDTNFCLSVSDEEKKFFYAIDVRMVEGLLLQQQPNRQRTASIASRSVIGITNGNRSNEVRKMAP